MIKNLQHRQLRAKVGQVKNKADRTRAAQALASWTFGRLAVDPLDIWWKKQLQPCPCGSRAHLFIARHGYATAPDNAFFACMCTACGRIAQPVSSGKYLNGYCSPNKAALTAVTNWNKGIEPKPLNPLSQPFIKRFEGALKIF